MSLPQDKQKTEPSLKNFLDYLSKIYSGVLVVVVYVSSLIFLGLISAFLIPGFKLEYYLAFIFLCILALDLLKKPWPFIARILNPITFFVSFLIIFLFVNYFLKIYPALNDKFLLVWKAVEGFLNEMVFTVMFVVVCGLIYLYLVVWLLGLIRRALNRTRFKEKVLSPIMGILLLIFFIFIPYAVTYSKVFSGDLALVLYQKIGWVGGISLIALHANFLIRIIFVKQS